MNERPRYYLPTVSAAEAIAAAVRSGAVITLTAEQSREVHCALVELRDRRETEIHKTRT
jgi:hypothetical protein